MALWGTAIDTQKAKKFVEPIVDNALPPSQSPPRPVINDPDTPSSTQHAKPTDHLPSDHGHATGDNTKPAFPTDKPQEDEEGPSDSWYNKMSGLVTGQKLFFAGLGAAACFVVLSVVFVWRRRVAKQKLENYTSLAADDIHMDAIGQEHVIAGSGGPRTTRALYDSFGEPSSENLPAQPSTANVNPPSTRGLGFHSGFLDDDEPSAGLTPSYRDEPVPERRSVDLDEDNHEGQDRL